MDNDFMTVGELASTMGVTVRTLQYYDKEGLLKPSATSKGGRRLYSSKDVIKLHQILSFKGLGFSLEEIKSRILTLNSPEEVARVLEQQKKAVEEQIFALQEAAHTLEALHKEALAMKQVDFKKYAEIIELLKMNNPAYWVWKFFDNTLTEHIRDRFMDEPERGLAIFDTYKAVLEEAVALKRAGEPADSAKSVALAEKWWNMIIEFTGGDMSLLPKLMEFNNSKEQWNKEMAEKQKEIDAYINSAFNAYFAQKEAGPAEGV